MIGSPIARRVICHLEDGFPPGLEVYCIRSISPIREEDRRDERRHIHQKRHRRANVAMLHEMHIFFDPPVQW